VLIAETGLAKPVWAALSNDGICVLRSGDVARLSLRILHALSIP
jgi:hypothetical protein